MTIKSIIVEFDCFTDLVLSSWPTAADENCQHVRTLKYTQTLNLAVGPKTAPTIEKQVGFQHLIETY